MEWVIAFTIFGMYSSQLFLVVAEYLKSSSTSTLPQRGFTPRRTTLSVEEQERRFSLLEEIKKSRCVKKVNWKEEGF